MTWTTFSEWLSKPDNLEHLLHLLEVSRDFPKGAYNALFNQQLERLIAQAGSPETKAEMEQALGMDWCGYIARALRSAGFRDHDIDPMTHEVVIRLLVNPGTLFKGWDGQPILPRFKLSVRNAVINLAQKQQTRRRRLPAISIGNEAGMASPEEIAGPQPSVGDGMIEAFRQFLRRRYGEAVLHVFDHRLAGNEVRELIRQGMTSYAVKEAVKQIKAAASEFAADDPELASMIDRAFRSEAETVARRFSAKTA